MRTTTLQNLSRRLALLMLACLFMASSALAKTIYVDTGGNDAFDGSTATFQGGVTGPKQTIAGAMAIAVAGDVISIEAGTYAESINANINNITFVARTGDGGAEDVTLTGNLAVAATGVAFQAEAAVNNFLFQGGAVALTSGSVNVGTGVVMLPAGVNITRTNAAATGSFSFGGLVNVTYNGTSSLTSGAELPADLNDGDLQVSLVPQVAGQTLTLTLAQATTVDDVDVDAGSIVSGTLIAGGNAAGHADPVHEITGVGSIGTLQVEQNTNLTDITLTGTLDVNNGNASLQSNITVMDVDLAQGGTVTLNANTLSVTRSFVRTGGTFSGNAGTLAFTGTANDGTLSGGPNFTIGDLSVNKNGRTLTVTQNVGVNGDVTIAQGTTVDLGSQSINILNDATPSTVTNNGTLVDQTGGGLVVNEAGTILQGTGAYDNITVVTPAGDIVLASNVDFRGILSLTAGGINAGGFDISPQGSAASVVVNVAGAGSQTITNGTFNNDNVRFDLSYIGRLNALAGNAFGAGIEFDNMVRNVTVSTTCANTGADAGTCPAGGTLNVPDPGANFSLAGNLTVNGGSTTVAFPVDRGVTLDGKLTITNTNAVSTPVDGPDAGNDDVDQFILAGGEQTHEIGGFLNVGEVLAINGQNTTLQGAGGTTVSEIEADGGILIDSGINLTVNDLKLLDASVTAGQNSNVTLNLAVLNPNANPVGARTNYGAIAGNLVLNGASLTLADHVQVAGNVNHNDGALNFGTFNLVMQDLAGAVADNDVAGQSNFLADSDVSYNATTGVLVFTNDVLLVGTSGVAIPNVEAGNITLATNVEVSRQLVLSGTVSNQNDGGTDVANNPNDERLSLSANAELVLTGNGTVTNPAGPTGTVQLVSLPTSFALTYRNYTGSTQMSTAEAPTASTITTLTIAQGAGNEIELDRNRTVQNLVLQSGELDLYNADLDDAGPGVATGTFNLSVNGDVTYAGGVLVSEGGVTGRLIFTGEGAQAFNVPTGGLTVPVNIDVELDKPVAPAAGDTLGSVVRLMNGNLDLATNTQDLILSGGLLLTGSNAVVLFHQGFGGGNTEDQGFVQNDRNSFVVGNVRKNVVNSPSMLVPIFAGRVAYPVGTPSGDYRPLSLVFPTEILTGQTFQTNITVNHVDANPQGSAGLPLDTAGVTITGYPDFYWLVTANPRLAPTAAYSIEATAEGFDLGNDVISDLRLIRRADGNAEENTWRMIGQDYANYLQTFGSETIPTVVASDARSEFTPGGTRITFGLSSSLALLAPIADQDTLMVGGPVFTVNLNNVFAGGDGDITFTATSSAPSIAAVSVDGSTLTVTPLAKGTAVITVTATDEGGNVNRTSFRVTIPTGVGVEEEPNAAIPTEFALLGNYPNPFNPTTSIQFDLPQTADVTVEIVDMLGRRVMTLPSQTMQAGAKRTVQINASSLASGMYVYRIIAKGVSDTHIATGRMMLVK